MIWTSGCWAGNCQFALVPSVVLAQFQDDLGTSVFEKDGGLIYF